MYYLACRDNFLEIVVYRRYYVERQCIFKRKLIFLRNEIRMLSEQEGYQEVELLEVLSIYLSI
jgi:hypothetical protein